MKVFTVSVLILIIIMAFVKPESSITTERVNIDRLPIMEEKHEVALDFNGSVTDTLSVEKIKRNENQKIVFRQKEKLNGNGSKSKMYYRENGDLFFMQNFQGNILTAQYQAFYNQKDLISHTQYLTFTELGVDSLQMDYNYTFNEEGKKESMKIYAGNDEWSSIYHEYYYPNEKVKNSFLVMNGDTIENSKYYYKNGRLVRKIDWKTTNRVVSVINFDKLEKEVNRRVFVEENDSLFLVKTFDYINDSEGNPQTTVVNDLSAENIETRKVFTTLLSSIE